jgi:hypothetical protein
MTALDNTVFTSAQFNQYVRDNLLETMPAKATAAGRWYITTAVNAIAERTISQNTVATYEATSSTTYTNLTTSGPAVTATTGTSALVFYAADMATATTSTGMFMSYAVSGATTIAASDTWQLLLDGITSASSARAGRFHHVKNLTAGSNTFTAKYRSGAAVAATIGRRSLAVMAL